MSFETPPDEVLIIEEQDESELARALPSRRSSWSLVAGIVIGSVGLSVAAAVVVRRLTSSRQGARGRRRGTLLEMRPHIGVFAPTLNISLPFSGINTTAPTRRGRTMGRRAPRMRGRTMPRGVRGRRLAGTAMRERRFARLMRAR